MHTICYNTESLPLVYTMCRRLTQFSKQTAFIDLNSFIWLVSMIKAKFSLWSRNCIFFTYRACINYRRISLRHNLSRNCRKIVKFVSITHSDRNIWNGPIVATAISRKKRKPVLEWNCCTWPPRSPDMTVCDFFMWGLVKDNVYVPPLPKTIPELQRAHQQRNWERHTRHAWEGLAGIGVSPGHLPCHTRGAHRMHLRSLWNCIHSSFKW